MDQNKIILDQIKADMFNIQVMVDMLLTAKKTHYSYIQSTIKQTIKDIKRQKEFINGRMYDKPVKHSIPLFEVEPSEMDELDMTNLTSFFGALD